MFWGLEGVAGATGAVEQPGGHRVADDLLGARIPTDRAAAGHLPEASPDPAVLAQLAATLPPADPGRLEPLYLKPPHITAPRRRPTEP